MQKNLSLNCMLKTIFNFQINISMTALKMIGFCAVFTLLFTPFISAQKPDETAIRSLLTRQTKDWNRG